MTASPPPSTSRPSIMGILNVTPDSFSDGGRHVTVDDAVAAAVAMARDGADMIDVGGESTRPGAQRIAAAEQIERTAPVIARLRRALDGEHAAVRISIDTTRAAVAERALDAGAAIINDVSAGRDDEAMFALAARRDVPIVLMHMLGQPATMQDSPIYENVVEQVLSFLSERAAAAVAAGVRAEHIIIDPGIGFGKTPDHNLALLSRLDAFVATGHRVLLGTSRKRFIRALCHSDAANDVVGGTCATTALGVAAGVQWFRVHEVKPNRHAADVAWAIRGRGRVRP